MKEIGKEKSEESKKFFSNRAQMRFLVPLFLSRPGLLPFTRLQFPFRFEQLTNACRGRVIPEKGSNSRKKRHAILG